MLMLIGRKTNFHLMYKRLSSVGTAMNSNLITFHWALNEFFSYRQLLTWSQNVLINRNRNYFRCDIYDDIVFVSNQWNGKKVLFAHFNRISLIPNVIMEFAVASICDSRSVCVCRSTPHTNTNESHRQWQRGDTPTISMVCFCACIFKSWTKVNVRRLVDQQSVGANCSTLRAWVHYIQIGTRLTKSQPSVYIVDVAAFYRASALQSRHIEQWHCINQTTDASYFHPICAIDSITVAFTSNKWTISQ